MIKRMLLVLTLLFLLYPFSVFSEIIQSSNRVDWIPGVTVGVPGGIPTNRAIFTNVVDAGMDNTGVVGCSTLLNSLIASCPSNQVVYMPAGTYWLNAYIPITKQGITLRGAGMGKTFLINSNAQGKCIEIGQDSVSSTSIPVTSGYTKGSSSLVLSSWTGVTSNNLFYLFQSNLVDQLVLSVGGAQDEIRRETHFITGTNVGNVINISPPIYFDFSADLAPRIRMMTGTRHFIGLEDFTLNHTNGAADWGIAGMEMHGCWIKNVESMYVDNNHIMIFDSIFCEVRGNYLHEAKVYGPSSGVGIELFKRTSGCLIEDNILYKATPPVMINSGSCGNVVGYNFAISTNDYVAYSDNHGAHNLMNLYEGNMGDGVESDGYFGSTSHGTIFRNWLSATNGSYRAIDLCRKSYWYNVVGNVLGNPTYTNYVYLQTTNSYPAGVRIIYRFGYPMNGNSSYVSTIPPDSEWYPGAERYILTLTNDVVNTNTLWGNFTGVDGAGDQYDYIMGQMASNTNFLYGLVKPLVGTSTNITLQPGYLANFFSGDALYRVSGVGGAYRQLNTLTISNTFLHGNYDYASNQIVWNSGVSDHTLPASYYLSSKPSWFGLLPFPLIGSDMPLTNINPAAYRFFGNYSYTNVYSGVYTNRVFTNRPSGGRIFTNRIRIR